MRAIAIESPLATRELGITWLGREPASADAALLLGHARALNRQYPGWADLNS